MSAREFFNNSEYDKHEMTWTRKESIIKLMKSYAKSVIPDEAHFEGQKDDAVTGLHEYSQYNATRGWNQCIKQAHKNIEE